MTVWGQIFNIPSVLSERSICPLDAERDSLGTVISTCLFVDGTNREQQTTEIWKPWQITERTVLSRHDNNKKKVPGGQRTTERIVCYRANHAHLGGANGVHNQQKERFVAGRNEQKEVVQTGLKYKMSPCPQF